MAKKSKQNSDFKKVKLKAGKKLTKGTNVTKTEFKSKRIVVKENQCLNVNPVNALKRNATCNTQFKNLCLEKINETFLQLNCDHITGDTINILSKLIIDYDKKVRSSAIKSIKQCIKLLNDKKKNVEPILNILLSYIHCGLTHIDSSINYDSKIFAKYIIENYLQARCKQLTKIMITRLDAVSNLDSDDYDLFSSFVQHLTRTQNPKLINSKVDTINCNWSSDNCNIDLSQVYKYSPQLNYNISFQVVEREDEGELFKSKIEDLVKKELEELKKRKHDNLLLTIAETKKLISCLQICRNLSISYCHLKDKLDKIQIITTNFNLNEGKKHQVTINTLKNKLKLLFQD